MRDHATPARPDEPGPTHPPTRRAHTTRKSVILVDRAADAIISIGGIFVILAVFGIMAFLADVVIPLFMGGSIESQRDVTLPSAPGRTLLTRIDEYRSLVIQVKDTGEVIAVHKATGARIEAPRFDLGERTVIAFFRDDRKAMTSYSDWTAACSSASPPPPRPVITP
ncbi:MAG: hypothetical protein U1E97_10800 [Alphaproteobacteria bacterium]